MAVPLADVLRRFGFVEGEAAWTGAIVDRPAQVENGVLTVNLGCDLNVHLVSSPGGDTGFQELDALAVVSGADRWLVLGDSGRKPLVSLVRKAKWGQTSEFVVEDGVVRFGLADDDVTGLLASVHSLGRLVLATTDPPSAGSHALETVVMADTVTPRLLTDAMAALESLDAHKARRVGLRRLRRAISEGQHLLVRPLVQALGIHEAQPVFLEGLPELAGQPEGVFLAILDVIASNPAVDSRPFVEAAMQRADLAPPLVRMVGRPPFPDLFDLVFDALDRFPDESMWRRVVRRLDSAGARREELLRVLLGHPQAKEREKLWLLDRLDGNGQLADIPILTTLVRRGPFAGKVSRAAERVVANIAMQHGVEEGGIALADDAGALSANEQVAPEKA